MSRLFTPWTNVVWSVAAGYLLLVLQRRLTNRPGDGAAAIDDLVRAVCWGGLIWCGLEAERRRRGKDREPRSKSKPDPSDPLA